MTAVCLREGVLAGRSIVRAGGGAICGDRCVALGADVVALAAAPLDEEAVSAEVVALHDAEALLADAATVFITAGAGYDALREALDGTWNAVRAVANAHLIGAGGGKVVLLAPAPGAGEHAGALRAALENTARTLSTEWARYGITTVAVLPGDATTQDEIAETAAFLFSEAGDYYSGCALTMGEVALPS